MLLSEPGFLGLNDGHDYCSTFVIPDECQRDQESMFLILVQLSDARRGERGGNAEVW